MPDDPSVIRWKVQTRMREMPDLVNHGGVVKGQVVAFSGVAVVTRVRERPGCGGVVVLEARLDPIELHVGEPVPVIRPTKAEAVEVFAATAR